MRSSESVGVVLMDEWRRSRIEDIIEQADLTKDASAPSAPEEMRGKRRARKRRAIHYENMPAPLTEQGCQD
jgi:hypothetical protein